MDLPTATAIGKTTELLQSTRKKLQNNVNRLQTDQKANMIIYFACQIQAM